MDTPQIMNAVEAKRLGLKTYFTGKPCKNGHLVERFVHQHQCSTCKNLWAHRNYKLNAEVRKAASKIQRQNRPESQNLKERLRKVAYRSTNKLTIKLRSADYYTHNKTTINARVRAWAAANREKVRIKDAAWRERNRALWSSYSASRQARVELATPSWVDRDAILDIYIKASQAKRDTGIPYTVDHIVPLKGKTVCGLHVPWNLQIMLHADNASKSNKLLDQMAAATVSPNPVAETCPTGLGI